MIRIRHADQLYLVEEADGVGAKILSQPLHRIFLRSQVNALPEDKARSWQIPLGKNPSVPLQKLIAHLGKYEIDFLLDETCKEILAVVDRKRKEFDRVLKDGLLAKNGLTASRYKNLHSELSGGFARHLTKLQTAAVNHLLTVRHGANFSVPGSGKTAVTLAYYYLLKQKAQIDAFIVIGPVSCFEPWEHEYKLCFEREPKSMRLAGNTKARRHELYLMAERYEFLLTTYHSTAKDVTDLMRILSRRRYLLILDESHYVKRPQGGKLAEAVLSLAEHAERRVILTGTPMPNGLPDLWSQFTFLWIDQKPLGNAEDYLFGIQQESAAKVMATVRHKIFPLFYRITKSQLDLPRPSFHTIKCEMSPLQARIYRGIAAKFLAQINERPADRETLREWRRARVMRLLQVASNPALLRLRCDEFQLPPMDVHGLALSEAIEHYAQYETPSKITTADKLARQICGHGEKLIIWSTFIHNLKMIAKNLQDLNPIVVHGGVPFTTSLEEEISREKLLSQFREDPSCQILIANPAACAESISLHMICHHAVYLDRSFNCAQYLQSLDRIHRLGLPRNRGTDYYVLRSVNSIDEVIDDRLKSKMKLMKDVVEGDLPGQIPGYWSEDLGDEETVDFQSVEAHIKSLFKLYERQTR